MNRLCTDNNMASIAIGIILIAAGISAIVIGISTVDTNGFELTLGTVAGSICILYTIVGGLITTIRSIKSDLTIPVDTKDNA